MIKYMISLLNSVMRNTVLKSIIISGFIVICLFLGTDTVHAQGNGGTISREDWSADDTILRVQEMYGWPSNIVIVAVPVPDLYFSDLKSFQELYYYFATRSEFGDFPFHFVLDSSGDLYQGCKYGREGSIEVEGSEEAVLVAYLYSGEEKINITAHSPIIDILTDTSNTYAIDPSKIQLKKLAFTISDSGKMENAKLETAGSGWNTSLSPILALVAANYAPRSLSYDVETLEVTAPESALEPTKTAEVKVKIKNVGQTNIYASLTKPFYIATDNPFDQRSLFFNEASWDSPSRIVLLNEGERLAAGEEKEVTVQIFIPLYPPGVSEDFVIVAPDGTRLESSKFTLSVSIKSSDKQIIEILETPVGYLNVRATPGLGEVVTKVAPKERFIVLDYQTGYYKIEANGKQGWVVAQYVRVIQ